MGDIVRVVRRGRFIGWYVRYRDTDGRRKMRASHQPSQALARRYLIEIEARIARGAVGIPEPAAAAPPLSDVVAQFLAAYARPRIKDLPRYRMEAQSALRRILPMLGSTPIDKLTRADIEKARDAVARKHPPNTVRATLRPLSAMLSWAVREGRLAANPARGIELPPRQTALEYLDAHSARSLLAQAEKQARTADDPAAWSLLVAVAFALYAGLRRGEIFGLRWSDLDLDAGRLTVARSYGRLPKSLQPRQLRLPAALVPLLREWRARCPQTAARLVCPVLRRSGWAMSAGQGDHGLGALLGAAGCRSLGRGWHALRHTFASHFVMQGGNILSLQRILGHADIKMTLVYAHLAPDFLGAEMDRLRY